MCAVPIRSGLHRRRRRYLRNECCIDDESMAASHVNSFFSTQQLTPCIGVDVPIGPSQPAYTWRVLLSSYGVGSTEMWKYRTVGHVNSG